MNIDDNKINRVYLDVVNNISKVDFYKQFLIDIINDPMGFRHDTIFSDLETILSKRIEELEKSNTNKVMYYIIGEYLTSLGYKLLDENLYSITESNLSHIIANSNETFCFIRQIYEDTFDSVGKRRIIYNFLNDVMSIKNKHNGSNVNGILWFVCRDTHSKQFYLEQFNNNRDLSIYYTEELFEKVFGRKNAWDEIFRHIKYMNFRINDDFLILDFTNDSTILEALKKLDSKLINKLKSNSDVYNYIRKKLFNNGRNLVELEYNE